MEAVGHSAFNVLSAVKLSMPFRVVSWFGVLFPHSVLYIVDFFLLGFLAYYTIAQTARLDHVVALCLRIHTH